MTQHAMCRKHDTALSFDTIDGRLVQWCVKCERQARKVCIDCGRLPRVHRSARCDPCYSRHTRQRENARRRRDCKYCNRPIEPGSKKRYCTVRCRNRSKQRKLMQEYERDPERHERRKAQQRAYRQTATGRATTYKHKRKGRLDGTWGYSSRELYLATQRSYNTPERAEEKRQWARDHQRKYSADNPPTCATCGTVIEWSGRGLPRKYCPPCHPWRTA